MQEDHLGAFGSAGLALESSLGRRGGSWTGESPPSPCWTRPPPIKMMIHIQHHHDVEDDEEEEEEED